MSTASGIELRELCKDYRARRALEPISLNVARGECLAVLGPNGAGKSTLARILATLTLPTSGSATVGGYDVVAQANSVRAILGYVPQAHGLDEYSTPRDIVTFFARLHRIASSRLRAAVDEVLAQFEIDTVADSLLLTCSGGQQRRTAIASALVHLPKVLVLDEPTVGLDPEARVRLWELLRSMQRAKSLTVLVNTHYLTEAETYADLVAILDRGRLLATGAPSELTHQQAPRRARLHYASSVHSRQVAHNLASRGYEVGCDDCVITVVGVDGFESLASLVDEVRAFEERPITLDLGVSTLEQAYFKLSGRRFPESDAAPTSGAASRDAHS